MSQAKPLGGKIFTLPFMFFAVIALAGACYTAQRFIYGIGAVSNMNDGYPWGIWIAYDVVVGTALACGGYAMALAVYVFNRGRYHSLVRPALMASMFGYTLAGVSVFFDIGRYWQMYNVFLPGYVNPNSVMLEVALCIATYCLVLWIEFTPAFLEKWQQKGLNRFLEKIIFIFIALGVLLPTMHQSSLGTMMILAGKKLSPLWWSPFLPVFYLLTALFMGYGIVLFETSLSGVCFGLKSETRLLKDISAVIPWLLLIFLAGRAADLAWRDVLPHLTTGTGSVFSFVLENLLLLAAFFILAAKSNRENPVLLFAAGILILLGGAVYRFNSYLIGFDPRNGWSYFPAAGELLITYMIIAVEIMAYIWFVKKLPVLPAR
jgi:Ni/Fe-hydrogenase subunit HybB-like protein